MGRVTTDFESYSEADLKTVGAWKYWEHPSTEALMCSFKHEDEPAIIWKQGEPLPPAVAEWVERGFIFDCHGANFEIPAWRWCVRNLGWPELPVSQWDDTMARAASLSLPLKLERLGPILNLDTHKDPAGKKWIKDFTQPRKPTKKDPTTRRIMTPADWETGVNYCLSDAATESALRKRVGCLSARERAIWKMDQDINIRGVQVDLPLAHRAAEIVADVELRLTRELSDVTGGAITSHSQVAQIVAWLATKGVQLEDLTADTVEAAVSSRAYKGTPAGRVLELRGILAKASTKKLRAFIRSAGNDGRVRYMQQYHGANTGRWAGRLINLNNLPKPPPHMEGYDPDTLAANIGTGSAAWLDMVYGDALVAVSTGLRTLLVAKPKHKLVAGDYTAVEAVGLAALAGEEKQLDVFRRKEDPYCFAATAVYGYPVLGKSTHPVERKTGKTLELACGYQGWVNAWRKFDDSDDHSDEEVADFMGKWRRNRPLTVAFWAALELAAVTAVLNPGQRIEVGDGSCGISYKIVGRYLTCQLPSGRNLSYCDPEVREGERYGKAVLKLSYMSWKGGRWLRVDTYGGKLAENCTQAVCRDVLCPGMLEAEARGLPIVLHVYDEVVVEVPENYSQAEEDLVDCMLTTQPWYAHWPLGVGTWEGHRYRKD